MALRPSHFAPQGAGDPGSSILPLGPQARSHQEEASWPPDILDTQPGHLLHGG